jgi:hypothetical protein
MLLVRAPLPQESPCIERGKGIMIQGKMINTTLWMLQGMHRGRYRLPGSGLSREKNLILILLAVLVALVLWNTFWWLARIALFVVIVYIIYLALREYL